MDYELIEGLKVGLKKSPTPKTMKNLSQFGLLGQPEQETIKKIWTNEEGILISIIESIFDLTSNDLQTITDNVDNIYIAEVMNGYKDFFLKLV